MDDHGIETRKSRFTNHNSEIPGLNACTPYFDTLFVDFTPLELPQGQMYRQPVNIHVRPCQKDTKQVPKGGPGELQGSP